MLTQEHEGPAASIPSTSRLRRVDSRAHEGLNVIASLTLKGVLQIYGVVLHDPPPPGGALLVGELIIPPPPKAGSGAGAGGAAGMPTFTKLKVRRRCKLDPSA